MRPDVLTLRDFYASPLGQVTAEQLVRRIGSFWPDLSRQHLLGLGYAPPLLDGLSGAASRAALMPAAQGVIHWPAMAENATALVEEHTLPLPDGSFDRILLLHALETAEDLRGLLRECWRVLAPEGRLIAIVPRRRGVWSGSERTPFASGQPFSRTQLAGLLSDTMLAVRRTGGALYLPPWKGLARSRAMAVADRIGAHLTPALSGVLIVECEKRIFAPTPLRRVRKAAPVRPLGAAAPVRRCQEPLPYPRETSA